MNIQEQLLVEHSKANALYIAKYIGNDQGKFTELVDLFLGDDYRITQRAGHALSTAFDAYPELIEPHIDKIITNLQNDVNDAVKRNTLRVLQNKTIPEAQEGFLATKCFDYLLSSKEPVAIKVFAMTVLANLCVKYPDLKNELKTIVEDLMQSGTPGIISRGTSVLKKLDSLR
ncbi:hypothetical protein [Reichenbachiella sp. MALMAid0571]|uniref:hypothetical protein n=1 Tax=Reichenbachiella sp. MALMAid0571 TaxID=3143939 RepID=UPI0032DE7D1D